MNLLRRVEELREFLKRYTAMKFPFLTEKDKSVLYHIKSTQSKIELWRLNGLKTFMLDKKLIEAFTYTDIPIELCPDNFKYPFPVFVVEGDGAPLFKTDIMFGGRYVDTILYIHKSVALADKEAMWIQRDGVCLSGPLWDHSIVAFLPENMCGFETISFTANDGLPLSHALTLKPLEGLAETHESDVRSLVNILFNTILYINDPSRPKDETERKGSRKLKVSNDGSVNRVSHEYIRLSAPKSYKSLSSGSSCAALDARFIVRGHYRNQAYGENWKDHRMIWIQPFWKGPELSEIVNKPYKVH